MNGQRVRVLIEDIDEDGAIVARSELTMPYHPEHEPNLLYSSAIEAATAAVVICIQLFADNDPKWLEHVVAEMLFGYATDGEGEVSEPWFILAYMSTKRAVPLETLTLTISASEAAKLPPNHRAKDEIANGKIVVVPDKRSKDDE